MNKLLNPEPCPVFMFRMQWKICGEPEGVSYARTKSRMANFVIEQGYSDRSRTPGLIQVCKVHPDLLNAAEQEPSKVYTTMRVIHPMDYTSEL